MKRFLILLSLLFCNTVCADTINLHWLNEDGTVYENSTCVIDSDLILPSTPPTKYGYTFTGWKMSNYQPIEYLESTGTQWIDAEYIPNNNTRVITDVEITGIANGLALFGFGKSSTSNLFRLLIGVDVNPYRARSDFGTSFIRGDISSTFKDKRIIVDKNKNITNITELGSNILTITNPYSIFTSDGSMYIFTQNRDNEAILPAAFLKLYYFQVYDNDILVRDFIPVLDYNNAPCLFDRVEGKFYYNQGTGQFIAGPVLQ